jgi:hypothetical protein
MSEKIFRLLLCLYPSHFRQQHGDEALQLFRDRFARRNRCVAVSPTVVELAHRSDYVSST